MNLIISKKFMAYIVSILALISLISHIPSTHIWITDILSHFQIQYSIAAFLIIIISLIRRYLFIAIAAAILIIFNLSFFPTADRTANATIQSYDQKLTIYSANINKSNNDLDLVVETLGNMNPDILLLLEVTDRNIRGLENLINNYPYKVIDLNVCKSGTGAILLSSLPIINHNIVKYTEFGNMMISSVMMLNNKRVAFYGVHFPKPTSIEEFPRRTKQIIDLAKLLKKESLPVIVAGDFNMTPFSPIFGKLIRTSNMKDTREGFGWLPSWPTYFPPLWIPIDHILVSKDIAVVNRGIGSYIGSDHYPVYAELAIQ